MSQQENNSFTLVFYYIPEDFDELSTPNAYAVPKNINDITLTDIEDLFPLNIDQSGKKNKSMNKDDDFPFHFRFKYKYNNQSVWLDLNNKKVKIPKFEGKIIMKVTRRHPKYLTNEKPFENNLN